MRACEHCGLSMSDTATFCAVCGTLADASASIASAASGSRDARGGMSVEEVVDHDDGASRDPEAAAARRLREASLPLREARQCESTDPVRSVALYREAILRLLEAAADPLDRAGVRHDLLLVFDRLSLVLKREGLPVEALEEIDCAASLGLLVCRDHGIKGHREALRKRRESLRRALDAGRLSADAATR